MKKYIYIVLFILAGWLLIGCNDYDDPKLNPNAFIGNPLFDVTALDTNFPLEGGESTIAVTTNTKWWTVKSSQPWAIVTSDTIKGDGSFVVKVDESETVGSREAILTLQSGTIGLKREIKIVQAGLPTEIEVLPKNLVTDAYGGVYELDVVSNATWTVELKMDQEEGINWCILDKEVGEKNGKVIVTITKNANADLSQRTASITFTTTDVVQTVQVKQVGFAACDQPNNTVVLYFDSFVPCPDAQVGDVWTLTDRRDDNVYKVRKMDDGQIWMIQDLRFAGNKGDQKTGLSFFSGDKGAEVEYIPGYLGDVAYPTIGAFPAETGYFYNWMGVMQDAKAADKAASSVSFIVDEPYKGVAPIGWHIPSSTEYKALDTAFGSDPAKWGPTGPWQGAYGGNLNETASSHWGRNTYGAYWTCTQTLDSETTSSPQQKAHVWKFYKDTTKPSEDLVTQPKKYGFTVRLVKNK